MEEKKDLKTLFDKERERLLWELRGSKILIIIIKQVIFRKVKRKK